jgi:hexosaminidase
MDQLSVIPYPTSVTRKSGSFEVSGETMLQCDARAESEGQLLANRLRTATGFGLPLNVVASTRKVAPHTISLALEPNRGGGGESYQLEITSDHVTIRAPGTAGLFYGVETLLQLLPPQVFSKHTNHGIDWRVPNLVIEDHPRFAWRGAMVDVSRHFFTSSEIKEFLDAMALHKLNVFHWHLTDDQGWRIEIKKYPGLTQVGAWRKRIGFNLAPQSSSAYGPDGRYGGYYTQEEVRDIVAYAKGRHITIVPEIEMPGHSSAALAAHPEFSCSGGPHTTDMAEAVSAGVFCVGNERTFGFLEDVLSEVMDLFPGEFVHVGGDEVPTGNWHSCRLCQARLKQEGLTNDRELEGYFLHRIEKFLNAHGRRMIGWTEIRNEHLAPSTVVMDWIGGGIEASVAGHDVVMSPEEFCYLDFYQSKDRSREPAAAGAYLPLERVYSFEPVPASLPPEARAHFLGGQGNLWTEYIPSLSQLEYMAFPRLSGLAEVLWSSKGTRNWKDFRRRLSVHEKRLQQLGINYYHSD